MKVSMSYASTWGSFRAKRKGQRLAEVTGGRKRATAMAAFHGESSTELRGVQKRMVENAS